MNGWTNRATWLVNMWFEPQSKEDVAMAREEFENTVDNLPAWLRDFVDQDIDWEEIEEHFEDIEDEENEDE